MKFSDDPELGLGISKTRIVRHTDLQDSAILVEMESVWKHATRDTELVSNDLAKVHVPILCLWILV
jgi:hypothetical protein